MTDSVPILIAAGAAPWELPLLHAFQRPEYGIRVVRRCVDHGELLGSALRDHPRVAVIAADLPWIDRDFVATLRSQGVALIALGGGLHELASLGVEVLAASASADQVAAAVHGLPSDEPVDNPAVVECPPSLGRVVAAWGGAGSPGRTVVAVNLAIESARAGRRTLLIDADVWSASVAQLLGLEEAPSLAQAAQLAADGWPKPLASCLHEGADGLQVLPGLARCELWPEVREHAWRAVLAAAASEFEVVVVDLAAPVEEDEDLVTDRIPYRRNLVTTATLERADDVVIVAAADPVGLRRALVAHRTLPDRVSGAAVSVVLNRLPVRAGRRSQECSRTIDEWTGHAPAALLPEEPAFGRVVWEGRPLHAVAPRSRWLRELRPLVEELAT